MAIFAPGNSIATDTNRLLEYIINCFYRYNYGVRPLENKALWCRLEKL